MVSHRAYNYFKNGWGEDQKANWFRALNVGSLISFYEESPYEGLPETQIYLYEEIYDYTRGKCFVKDCSWANQNNGHCNHSFAEKVDSFYNQLPPCKKHPSRKATFWFYYGLTENVVPELDALCDDCLVNLKGRNLQREYDESLQEIYPLCQEQIDEKYAIDHMHVVPEKLKHINTESWTPSQMISYLTGSSQY